MKLSSLPSFYFTDGHKTWVSRGSWEGSAKRRLAENLVDEWDMPDTERSIREVEDSLTLTK